MNKKDQEIQRKLDELETTILKEQTAKALPARVEPSHSAPSNSLSSTSAPAETIDAKSDLQYFGGIALICLGLIQLFQHVRLSSGFMGMLGMGGGGFGMLLIPLLIGVGWLFYDSKSTPAKLLTGASCVIMVLSILSSLVMVFPSLSVLQTIFMLLPIALGGAMLLKGMGGARAVTEKLKKYKS